MRKLGENFFSEYLRYTHDQESPDVYHLWCAISIVLSLLGRRCSIDRELFRIYPNEYIILVGPSGRTKKDTAIDIAVEFLSKLPHAPERFVGTLTASSLKGHLSRMTKQLPEDPDQYMDATLNLVADEFSALVGRYPFNEDLLTTLTDLYKAPQDAPYETRKHGLELIHNVCINMLCGSTPKWLGESIPKSAVGGGFTARVLFVHAEHPKHRRMKVSLPSDGMSLRANLIYDLSEIGMMEGEFAFTKEANEFLTEWYEKGFEYNEDSPLEPYYERKIVHIQKVSMAFSAVRSDEKRLTLEDAQTAKTEIEKLEPGMATIVGQFELSELTALTVRVYETIRKHEPINKSRLQQLLIRKMGRIILEECVSTLLEGGFIVQGEGGKSGRATTYKTNHAVQPPA